MENNLRRLFFAFWPDNAARREAQGIIKNLQPKLSARWISPPNLHVTLAFLGDIEAGRVETAKAVADTIEGAGFELRLDTLEHWRKPQVLCLTPSSVPPTVEQLAADLADRLKTQGFKLDDRAYRPHLTLARKALYLPADIAAQAAIVWQSTSFVLAESHADKRGSYYQILQTWPLTKTAI
jgi:2'-5' RNA ligase